jgi:hypothetical protein
LITAALPRNENAAALPDMSNAAAIASKRTWLASNQTPRYARYFSAGRAASTSIFRTRRLSRPGPKKFDRTAIAVLKTMLRKLPNCSFGYLEARWHFYILAALILDARESFSLARSGGIRSAK